MTKEVDIKVVKKINQKGKVNHRTKRKAGSVGKKGARTGTKAGN